MVATKSDVDLALGSLFIRFFVTFGSAVSGISLLVGTMQWILGWQILANTGILGVAFLFAISALAGTMAVLFTLLTHIQRLENNERSADDNKLADTLIGDLEAAYEAQRWEEVLKIGGVLSRPLWVTGKYQLRTKLGRLVESAAAYSDKPSAQAAALIDDLGWTKYMLGDVSEAKQNILHGITIAQRVGDAFLAYKGHRHLSTMASEAGALFEASAQLEKAEEIANQLPEGKEKQDAFAGLQFNRALLEISRKNWQQALDQLDSAEASYRSLQDDERLAKIYQYRGDALLHLGRLAEAKDVYRHGVLAATQESRKDGVLQNYLGIARVAAREGDIQEARRVYTECGTLARELGRTNLANEIEGELAALRKAQN